MNIYIYIYIYIYTYTYIYIYIYIYIYTYLCEAHTQLNQLQPQLAEVEAKAQEPYYYDYHALPHASMMKQFARSHVEVRMCVPRAPMFVHACGMMDM